MRFGIELFNSVDGSCRLMAVAGWLRFVCSNGLIIGADLIQLRQQHRQQLEVEEIGRLVGEAIDSAQGDRDRFVRWMSTRVEETALVPWVDEEVRSLWGVKAAVRVLGIATGGWDVEPLGAIIDRRPSVIRTNRLGDVRVPGIDAPVGTLFGVSQVLSWIAGQRAEISEDLQWRSQVHISRQNWTRNRISTSLKHPEHPVQQYVGYRFPSRQNVPNNLAQFAR